MPSLNSLENGDISTSNRLLSLGSDVEDTLASAVGANDAETAVVVRAFASVASFDFPILLKLVFAAALLGVGVEETTMPLFAC